MAGKLSTEDKLEILDLIARYNQAFDSGNGEAYAALWTADGELKGMPQPCKGSEALKGLVAGSFQHFKGGVRHHTTDVVAEYGNDKNTINLKAYTLVTNWSDGGKIFALAEPEQVLVKDGGSWKIKTSKLNMRPATA
jgi:hypothetical protein